jgi:hypothetical protein
MAGRLMTKIFPQWVQDLALLIESAETVRRAFLGCSKERTVTSK